MHVQVEIMVIAPSTPAPTPYSEPAEVGMVSTVTATATLFDQSLSADNGCDPSGCTAGLTRVSHNRSPNVCMRPDHVFVATVSCFSHGNNKPRDIFVRAVLK